MEIFKQGSRSQKMLSSDYFYGIVFQDPIIVAPELSKVRAVKVSFEPKARTAWHFHPLGQTLFVLSGLGLIGLRNKSPQIINVGDTVWISPNEEHWHGAIKENSMEHVAIH